MKDSAYSVDFLVLYRIFYRYSLNTLFVLPSEKSKRSSNVFFFEREKKIKFKMNFSSKGNTYPFIFFYSFTIENMFKYQRDYISSILSSFFSILDSSIHKEIFEPNRKANKQKKKGGAFRLRVCAQ